MHSVIEKAKTIKLLAMDVDGVLTNGSLYFGNSGEEMKAFSILDGLGIKLLRDAGITPAIITGRCSELVKRRAGELKIELIYQGREDKLTTFQTYRPYAKLGLALPLPTVMNLLPATQTGKPALPAAVALFERFAS